MTASIIATAREIGRGRGRSWRPREALGEIKVAPL